MKSTKKIIQLVSLATTITGGLLACTSKPPFYIESSCDQIVDIAARRQCQEDNRKVKSEFDKQRSQEDSKNKLKL